MHSIGLNILSASQSQEQTYSEKCNFSSHFNVQPPPFQPAAMKWNQIPISICSMRRLWMLDGVHFKFIDFRWIHSRISSVIIHFTVCRRRPNDLHLWIVSSLRWKRMMSLLVVFLFNGCTPTDTIIGTA